MQSFVCVGADDDDGQRAVEIQKKQPATKDNLIQAKTGGFSIDDVKKKYTVTPAQEQEFLTL